ncbi:hypothetical protein CDL15_Pgr005126 [Punica granatum]|uniref:Myb-like domain-containing protein n=1 Tax=Punica granatum TaxID=22663 RepID=A0A218WNW0_PUNGR|nr:hypothetical protein CDL15_Pgr005126 [Punica granatum]
MDTWRRIKLPDLKNGCWSQEEYRNLFNLVNMDLQMKAVEEKVSRHGMLNYNVCWEAISRKLSTQTNASCCTKWPGVVSWKRWAQSQMVRHIGEHRMKSSVEQVEILSKRCCPNLLQVRDAWDKKCRRGLIGNFGCFIFLMSNLCRNSVAPS